MEKDKKVYQKMVVKINFIVGFFFSAGQKNTYQLTAALTLYNLQ